MESGGSPRRHSVKEAVLVRVCDSFQCLKVFCALVLLLLILTAIAIGFYFGMFYFKASAATTYFNSTAPAAKPEDNRTLVEIIIDGEDIDDLLNSTFENGNTTETPTLNQTLTPLVLPITRPATTGTDIDSTRTGTESGSTGTDTETVSTENSTEAPNTNPTTVGGISLEDLKALTEPPILNLSRFTGSP